MTNLFDLTGRTAVVTGAAQGMGRAMAVALAEAGARLVLLDRDAAGIEATAHQIGQSGREALPIAGDVTAIDHIDHVFATVDRAFGQVDILGNVAGEAKAGAAEEMKLADVRTTFHNLVISRYYTCQLAGRRMLAQGKASILISTRPRSTIVRTGGGTFGCPAKGPPRHVRSWKPSATDGRVPKNMSSSRRMYSRSRGVKGQGAGVVCPVMVAIVCRSHCRPNGAQFSREGS